MAHTHYYYASLSRNRESLFVAGFHQGPVALSPLDRTLGKEEYDIQCITPDGVGVL